MEKQSLISKIEEFGYHYVKDIYERWLEYFIDDDEDCSYYKDSYDSENHPYEDNLIDQVGEQSWHAYSCNELFEELNLNEGEQALLDEIEEPYDVFWNGVEKFLKETYK